MIVNIKLVFYGKILEQICSNLLTLQQITNFIFISEICSFPNNWTGKWFHLGFPEPLAIGPNSITGKGACVKMSKNMFLMEER